MSEEIPVGSRVGEIRILSSKEAIRIIRENDYFQYEIEKLTPEEKAFSDEMMISFIESQNLVCGIDTIGQLLLYWHGSPGKLVMNYMAQKDAT